MTAIQKAVVDDLGNINVHGRSGLEIVWKVKDADANLINISASDLFVEIAGKIRIALTAGEDNYSRKLTLTRAQVATLPLNQPLDYALHDETPSSPATIWSGKITAYGFRTAPSGADAVAPGTASWTGATVTVQQGESVPTVVVTYMGATGYGVPTGGTTGQYLRKASATEFDSAFDTITSADVSGLDGQLDLKLNLAGGTLSGVLAFVAGTAALPGLAVAGDLNTGIYGVSADVLGVTAGGSLVQSWGVGTSTLTGNLLAGADATYDLGLSGSGRFRDYYASRNVIAGTGVSAGTYLRVNGSNAGYIALGTADDVLLRRDDANTLALRNGVNDQLFNVYRTYTDASNYERLQMGAASGIFYIRSQAAGTGTARSVVLYAASALYLGANGTYQWGFPAEGTSFGPVADATYDIGTSSAQIRDAYLSRNLTMGASGVVLWNGRARLSSAADGELLLANSASTAWAYLNVEGKNTLALRRSTNPNTFRGYYSYTDASNYARWALTAGAAAMTLAAESAGTGAANIDIALTPKGTGVVKFGTHSAIAAETVTGFITIKDSGGTLRKLAVVS